MLSFATECKKLKHEKAHERASLFERVPPLSYSCDVFQRNLGLGSTHIDKMGLINGKVVDWRALECVCPPVSTYITWSTLSKQFSTKQSTEEYVGPASSVDTRLLHMQSRSI